MMSDEAVLHVHDFHQIHLFAIGGDTRVFPDQSLPVGEECGSMPTPDVGRAIKHSLYEFPKIIAATHDPSFASAQMTDKRTLECGIYCVELYRRIEILPTQCMIPFMVDALGCAEGL